MRAVFVAGITYAGQHPPTPDGPVLHKSRAKTEGRVVLEHTDMTSSNDPDSHFDCFDGWANYPDNSDVKNATILSAPSLNNHLTRLSGHLFSATVDIQVIGITSDGMSVSLCKK